MNAARLNSLGLLITGVIQHRTVNLAILATTDDGKEVSNETRYRRFQDFFLNAKFCFHSIGLFILSRVPKPREGYSLAMDRTNWKFGRKHINFLVISIIAGNVSIPIVWKVLPQKTKRGNSNTAQRKALTGKLLRFLSAKDIYVLTMDREFVGKQWLEWLDSKGVAYVVRIKGNITIGSKGPASKVKGRHYKLKDRQNIFGLQLFFSRKRMSKKGRSEHVLVVSNCFQGKEALELYKKRWGIERLFWHIKQKGFDLESTHMTTATKLDKLFAVTALAFLFSFTWGCKLQDQGAHKNVHTKRKSFFRIGLEDMLRIFSCSYFNPRGVRDKRRIELQEFKRWLLSESPYFFLV